MGLTGPLLRAAGVARDLRRDNPYLVYSELDFDVITATESDALARFYVRIAEMKESAKILRQALDRLPEGPYNALEPKRVLPSKERTYTKMEELIHDFMLVNLGIDPPVGEVYSAVESSKGELGFYIVSDGTGHPWRLKIRSPSMTNLQALPLMLKGGMISDIVAIIGSLDPVMGEADK
jgi:NADH-quinone oxidoreductase subunit D